MWSSRPSCGRARPDFGRTWADIGPHLVELAQDLLVEFGPLWAETGAELGQTWPNLIQTSANLGRMSTPVQVWLKSALLPRGAGISWTPALQRHGLWRPMGGGDPKGSGCVCLWVGYAWRCSSIGGPQEEGADKRARVGIIWRSTLQGSLKRSIEGMLGIDPKFGEGRFRYVQTSERPSPGTPGRTPAT